jgi:hypothetical protein
VLPVSPNADSSPAVVSRADGCTGVQDLLRHFGIGRKSKVDQVESAS